MGSSADIKVGLRTKIGKWVTLARNMQITNMGKENVLSRRRIWLISSASTVMPKDILHEIVLNLRRYSTILKLVNFV